MDLVYCNEFITNYLQSQKARQLNRAFTAHITYLKNTGQRRTPTPLLAHTTHATPGIISKVTVTFYSVL